MATRDNTNYKVVNPTAGNVFYDHSGSALSNSSQPLLNRGRAIGLGSTAQAGMVALEKGDRGRTVFSSQVVARPDVGAAAYGNVVSTVSVAASGGFARYTKSSHGLAVGAIINVADTNSKVHGPQRVTAVGDANTFDTNKHYVSGAGTITYYVAAGNFATMTAGAYVMRRVTTTLAGLSKTQLRSGASDYGIRRSIHKAEVGRVTKTATAVRAGYWNIVTGEFSAAPSNATTDIGDVAGSSVTNGTADHAATPTRSVPGELTYKEPKPLPVNDDYQAKTNG